jgi:hypothetical protein
MKLLFRYFSTGQKNMPLNDAKNFLHEAMRNTQLRTTLLKASSRKDLEAILKANSYVFTLSEIEDAYRNLLVNCQSEEQAQLVKDIKQWWEMLLYMTPERVIENIHDNVS